MRRWAATVVALSFTSMGLASCSGDSAPTLAAWQAEVDALCAAEPDPDLEFTAESFRAARDEFVPYLESIKDAGVPDERADDVERVHELLDRQIELIDDVIEIIERDGAIEDTVDVLGEARELDAELDRLAQSLGVPACVDEDDAAVDGNGLDGADGDGAGGSLPAEIPPEITASDLSPAQQLFAAGLTVEGFTPAEAVCVASGLFTSADGQELERRLLAGEPAGDLIDPVIGGVVTSCLTAERLLEIADR